MLSAYVSIRQHTSAYVSIRQHAYACSEATEATDEREISGFKVLQTPQIRGTEVLENLGGRGAGVEREGMRGVGQHTSVYASIRQHMSAYASIRQ